MPRRLLLAVLVFALIPLTVAKAHLLDHPVPTLTGTAPPLSSQFNSGGENAEWELLATIPTGNPHSDLDFFQQQGETYASVGNLGVGANGGGQIIVKLTNEGEVDPQYVSNIPTASCVQDPSAALGLQHDIEATPKASTIANTEVSQQNTQDTKLLVDATDAAGRCHDQGVGGLVSAPYGGLEIIDVTDVTNPKEIGLTSHIGEAHTVNIDPRRPHIAYVVSSDSTGVDEEGKRANEDPAAGASTRRALDGFEIVDLRSCLEAPLGTIPAGATIEEKRDKCRPEVYRYRYPSVDIALGHTNQEDVYGCHELEVYPDDRLTCGSGAAMILFDIKGLFNNNGTPTNFTDDRINGQPLPCRVRDTSTTLPGFGTGAKVTDCVTGGTEEEQKDLAVPGWIEIGSPSATGIEHVGSAFHMGRESATGAVQPAYPAQEDIDFDHEAELTDSRKFILATDERGGGVLGGAQCTPGADLSFANGGIHAYKVDELQKSTPKGEDPVQRAEQAFKAYATNSEGDKAIYRAPVQTGPQASFCTAHVFQQIPGENRIFMGWYSQGTQVIDFTEKNGKIDFERAGYFIPENANQWVSAIFKVERNADGTTTYYGVASDGIVGEAVGRDAIDIYKVTLPAAPLPPNRVPPPNAQPGTNPNAPNTPGLPTEPTPQPGCAVASGFSNASVAPAGKGLRFDFTRNLDAPVRADVFQSSAGRQLVNRKVARFNNETKSFVWKGKRGIKNGTYVARLRIKVPGRGTDTRRFSLLRKKGRFTVLPDFKTPVTCGLLRKAELKSNAFGGKKNGALGIQFRLSQAAQVTAVIKRGNKVVKTIKAKTFQPGKTQTLRFKARKRGAYTVALTAKRGQQQATATLSARRI